MKKIITVDVAKLLRKEEFCIDVVADGKKTVGRRVDILDEQRRLIARVVFDNNRTQGARVWVETTFPVWVDTAGRMTEIP